MLRSIKQALDIIKTQDKDTAITMHCIRSWVKENKIRSLRSGKKILIDVESLLDYINNIN